MKRCFNLKKVLCITIHACSLFLFAACQGGAQGVQQRAIGPEAMIGEGLPADVRTGFLSHQLFGSFPAKEVQYLIFNDGGDFSSHKKLDKYCIVSKIFGWTRCYKHDPLHIGQSTNMVVVLFNKRRCAELGCPLNWQELQILDYKTGATLASHRVTYPSPPERIILEHAIIRGRRIYFQTVPRKFDIQPEERQTFCIDLNIAGGP